MKYLEPCFEAHDADGMRDAVWRFEKSEQDGANLELTGYHSRATSYGYAAPLDECDDPSSRFAAYHDVLLYPYYLSRRQP